LIEVHPGLGTVVGVRRSSTAAERGVLLKKELEQLVVEAKKLGLDLNQITEAITQHWYRLDAADKVLARK
jgi:GntR family transcriptional regulator